MGREEGGSQEPGRKAVWLVLSPVPSRLPAVGHGARSRLERWSQPGQARLRQRLQTGQPEGSHLIGWGPGSLKHVGRWRRVISGARPEPLFP